MKDFRYTIYEDTFAFICNTNAARNRFNRILPLLKKVLRNTIDFNVLPVIAETRVEAGMWVITMKYGDTEKNQALLTILKLQYKLMKSICCEQCGFENYQSYWKGLELDDRDV